MSRPADRKANHRGPRGQGYAVTRLAAPKANATAHGAKATL